MKKRNFQLIFKLSCIYTILPIELGIQKQRDRSFKIDGYRYADKFNIGQALITEFGSIIVILKRKGNKIERKLASPPSFIKGVDLVVFFLYLIFIYHKQNEEKSTKSSIYKKL